MCLADQAVTPRSLATFQFFDRTVNANPTTLIPASRVNHSARMSATSTTSSRIRPIPLRAIAAALSAWAVSVARPNGPQFNRTWPRCVDIKEKAVWRIVEVQWQHCEAIVDTEPQMQRIED